MAPTPKQDVQIPFALPDVGDAEAWAVAKAINSGWITSGPTMDAFENEFTMHMGGEVASVAVGSATAGLHLALEAVGIGPGDEVIVPTWTFTATAEVVRYLGATPVIVDVETETLNIDIEATSQAVSPRTRAVLPVHLAGLPVDLIQLKAALGQTDIKIIEDAAHALPALGTTGLVGNCQVSDAAVFSFYATKPVTTGEGGMITTRDCAIADRARVMRLHGIDRSVFDRYTSTKPAWVYDVVAPGFKYNMPDTAAAMGRVQLSRSCQMHSRRQEIAERYLQEFSDLPLQLPPRAPDGQIHSWHLFIIRVDPDAGTSRDEFVSSLSARGIGTSVHYIPLHEHTYWRSFVGDARATLPNAIRAAPNVVSLPIYSKLTDDEVDLIIATVRAVLA